MFFILLLEAKAAKLAGLNTIVLNRPGNKSFSDEEKQQFNIVESFADIIIEPVVGNKRKIDADTYDQVCSNFCKYIYINDATKNCRKHN